MQKKSGKPSEILETKKFSQEDIHPKGRITFTPISPWRQLLVLDIEKTFFPKDGSPIKVTGTIREYTGTANVEAIFFIHNNNHAVIEIYQ